MTAPELHLIVPDRSVGGLVGRARELLAEALTIDDVLDVRDRAAALERYFKQRQDGTAAHADAWEVTQRANIRLGELFRELPKAKPGPAAAGELCSTPERNSKRAELKKWGVGPTQASRWERASLLAAEEREARIARGRAKIERRIDGGEMTAPSSAAEYDGDAYGTPLVYLDAAREVYGDIELDPASNPTAQRNVRAARYHTKDDSSLDVDWIARTVWFNPPYSRGLIDLFVAKFVVERQAGHFESAIVLVNSSTETGWYHEFADETSRLCLPDHRIAFELDGVPIDQNRYAQTFFYAGPEPEVFTAVFSRFGKVLRAA